MLFSSVFPNGSIYCLEFASLCSQIVSNTEDLKQSVEERTSAVRKADEGAADLKKRVTELSQGLEEYEKEYQVNSALNMVIFALSITAFGTSLCLKILLY